MGDFVPEGVSFLVWSFQGAVTSNKCVLQNKSVDMVTTWTVLSLFYFFPWSPSYAPLPFFLLFLSHLSSRFSHFFPPSSSFYSTPLTWDCGFLKRFSHLTLNELNSSGFGRVILTFPHWEIQLYKWVQGPEINSRLMSFSGLKCLHLNLFLRVQKTYRGCLRSLIGGI